jgi:hypothetical protein
VPAAEVGVVRHDVQPVSAAIRFVNDPGPFPSVEHPALRMARGVEVDRAIGPDGVLAEKFMLDVALRLRDYRGCCCCHA